MGLSPKHYESFRDAARKQAEIEAIVAELDTRPNWSDDPAYTGDYEDPFADLEAGEYERELFQDAAEDYQRFGGL